MTTLFRSRWAAIGAAVAVTLGAGGLVAVNADSAESVFVAVNPTRVLDSRIPIGLPIFETGVSQQLQVTGEIAIVEPGDTPGAATVVPDGATAIVANVTAVGNTTIGFVSVRPGDATGAPTTSNVNLNAPNQAIPNSVTVELDADGEIDLYFFGTTADATTHLIVDIVGYYLEGQRTPGPQGEPGQDGVDGVNGVDGADGVDGIDGVDGQDGADGVRIGPALSSALDTIGDTGSHTSIAIGTDGNPVIAYRNTDAGTLSVAACSNPICDSGVGATGIHAVDATGNVGSNTSIVIADDGNPIISYYDINRANLNVAACTNPTCDPGISAADIHQVDTAGQTGQYTSIILGTDGNPVISYYDVSAQDLNVAACTNPTCDPGISAANIHQVDTTNVTGWHTSMVLGIDGNPIISYYDASDGDLNVAACTNPTCDPGISAANIHQVDTTDSTGQFTSMVLGIDGNPIISYYDASDGDLNVAACTNPTCDPGISPADIYPLDTDNSAGSHTSIVVGANGNPVISYHDFTAADLNIAACIDPRCTTAVIAQADTQGNKGEYTSIVLGADGNPVISYYAGGPDNLKVYACGNTMCSPHIKVGR